MGLGMNGRRGDDLSINVEQHMKPNRAAVLAVLAGALAVAASEEPSQSVTASRGLETLWGEEVGGWRVGAAVARKGFAGGEPVLVRVAIQNMSQAERQVRVERWGETQVWEVEASGPRGIPSPDGPGARVELTRLGRWLYGRGGGPPRSSSTTFARLGPGQQRSEIIQISDLLDMSMPGKYMVTIRRTLWDYEDSQVTVESPPIEIEVGGGRGVGDPRYWQQIFLVGGTDPVGGTAAKPRSPHVLQQYARTTRIYVDDILRIASEEPQDEAAEAARKELRAIRAELDAALRPVTGAEGAAEPAPDSAARGQRPDRATPAQSPAAAGEAQGADRAAKGAQSED